MAWGLLFRIGTQSSTQLPSGFIADFVRVIWQDLILLEPNGELLPFYHPSQHWQHVLLYAIKRRHEHRHVADQYINCFSWHVQHTSASQNCMCKHAVCYILIHAFHKGTSPDNHISDIGTTYSDHTKIIMMMVVVQYLTGGVCRSFSRAGTLFCVTLRCCRSPCRAAVLIWFTHCSESCAFVSVNQLHWPDGIRLINILLKWLPEYKNQMKHQGKFFTYLEKKTPQRIMNWPSLQAINGFTEGEEQNYSAFPHSAASLSASGGRVLYHLYFNVMNGLGIQCCRVFFCLE